MIKFKTIIIAAALFAGAPAVAESTEAPSQAPLTGAEFFAETGPLAEGEALFDEFSEDEMDNLRHGDRYRDRDRYRYPRYRRCRRGYHLERYYVRIGRIVYTRYECVRDGRRRRDHRRFDIEQPAFQEQVQEQTPVQ